MRKSFQIELNWFQDTYFDPKISEKIEKINLS